MLDYSGPLLVGLFSGSFVVEVLFSIRGLGMLFIQAISDRDYTVIMGVTLLYGMMMVGVSFGVDILQHRLNPRLEKTL